jgi:hypothetical protein
MEGNKNKFGRGEFFFLLDVPVRERDHRRIVFIRTHILRNVLTGESRVHFCGQSKTSTHQQLNIH